MKRTDRVFTKQARKGDFYTHLFETEDAPKSLCGLDERRFYQAAGSPTVEIAIGGRSDICGRCARVARARLEVPVQ